MPGVRVEETFDEPSEYRIGGDVQVVTREEIEERRYTSVSEAISRIPGVQISSPGYRGQEYGTTFGEEVSINGDSGVVITIDGRRLDNDASSFGGARSKSRSPLSLVPNVHVIERIEVIKGMGAVAYGAEATGGIINIVTRRGYDHPESYVNLARGSWGREDYTASQAGPTFSGGPTYIAVINYGASHDTRYKDDDTGNDVTFLNTRFHEMSSTLRLDQAFGDVQRLTLQWDYSQGRDHYPITAPDTDTLYLMDQDRLPSSSTAPGYRNWFLYDARLGSYNEDGMNNVDLKYVFADDQGLTSFVRGFHNYDKYYTRDFAGLFGIQPGRITQADTDRALASVGTRRHEQADGAELQLARNIGRHGLITGWTYTASEYEQLNVRQQTTTHVNRDSLKGYLQDKITLTSRWIVSPGFRYEKYDTIERVSATNVVTTRGDTATTTFAAQSNYRSDLLGDFYVFWAQVERPMSNYDYDAQTTEPLRNEQGNSWQAGLRKPFGEETFVGVSYSLLDMDNAIARYSVFDPTVVNTAAPTGFGNYIARSVNATQRKEAVNISASHALSPHWTVSGSYTAINEEFKAKNFANNPNDTNINALINKFRPRNSYQADVFFRQGRLSASLATQYYTGNDTRYFSDRRFLVVGAVLNCEVFRGVRAYLKGDNLTNESGENKASASYGPGAFPQPGRNFLAGVSAQF